MSTGDTRSVLPCSPVARAGTDPALARAFEAKYHQIPKHIPLIVDAHRRINPGWELCLALHDPGPQTVRHLHRHGTDETG